MWTKESFTAGRLAVTWGSCCLFSGRFSPSVALTHAVVIPPTGLPSALLSPFKSLLRFPASYFNRLYHVHPQSNTSVAPGCLPLCLSDSGNLLITELHLCRPGPQPPHYVFMHNSMQCHTCLSRFMALGGDALLSLTTRSPLISMCFLEILFDC